MILQDIDRETNGLRARYEKATADAAFLIEDEVNGGVSVRASDRQTQLTSVVIHYEARIRALQAQRRFYEGIDTAVTGFGGELSATAASER